MHLACLECGQLHRSHFSNREGGLLCVRCGSEMRRASRRPSLERRCCGSQISTGSSVEGTVDGRGDGSIDRTLEHVDPTLALTLAALVFFLLANAFPLLSLNLRGTIQTATLPGCVQILTAKGWPWLAAILLTTVELVPLAYLSGLATVLIQIRRGRSSTRTARLFRRTLDLQSWGMVEVFILGILISYVKLSDMAVVLPGPSAYALAIFMLLASTVQASLDPDAVWQAIQDDPGETLPAAPPANLETLQACHACGLLSAKELRQCPRCAGPLHVRKPDAITRTWALLITAAILYVPANVLPVMRVTTMGHDQADTILGGILYFLHSGSWPLALVIFLASIVVPILKLGILTFLLLSVRRKSTWNPRLRTRLYQFTELIGRWSMVDIFVVILMVAMVEMGSLASVEPCAGAMAFALVVAATMLASRSFDPRILWDHLNPEYNTGERR